MYLVDTSVWIDYFNERHNPSVHRLEVILDENIPFGITPAIYQEILQGTSTEKDLFHLEAYFKSQTFYYPRDAIGSYTQAAWIYFSCRRKGLTIRSTIDCLIAQICIEHKLILLHNDRDFKAIATHFPELRHETGLN